MQDDQAPEIENEGEQAAQAESATAETQEATQEPQAEPEKKADGVQKRINQLTREKYEERRQREELETRLKELESQVKPQTMEAPNEADFDDYATYQLKNAEYIAELAAQKLSAKSEAATQAQRQQQQYEERVQRAQQFNDRVASEQDRYEGFMEKVNDPVFSGIVNSMDADVLSLIQESEKGVALAYHLANDLAEADRIAKLSPVLAARELVNLEARLELPQPKKISDAPDPIRPIGGNEPAVKEPDQMSMDEWMSWRNKQARR